jgi:predicted lipoprotein
MKQRSYISLFFSFILILVLFVACKKPKIENDNKINFEKAAMLNNYADQLIVPNINGLKVSVDSLAISFDTFLQTKSISNLKVVREKFIVAYLKFQQVSAFEFGPSEQTNLRGSLNTFPANATQINANINSGNYNLGTVDNIAAKGFPALDYLLFGNGESDSAMVNLFNGDLKAAGRRDYLNACLSEIKTKVNTIYNDWNNSYKSTFVASTGSEVGSSFGMLINQLNFEMDLLKNNKIGIPLGKKSLGIRLPEKCESYYARTVSLKLAKTCLLNIENIYLGRSTDGRDGLGIDDYLISLDAKHGSESLDKAIKDQFAAAKTKLDQVPEPLAESVNSEFSKVDAAYFEIVKLLVLLKTDTPSALGIVITYQDNDGD